MSRPECYPKYNSVAAATVRPYSRARDGARRAPGGRLEPTSAGVCAAYYIYVYRNERLDGPWGQTGGVPHPPRRTAVCAALAESRRDSYSNAGIGRMMMIPINRAAAVVAAHSVFRQ